MVDQAKKKSVSSALIKLFRLKVRVALTVSLAGGMMLGGQPIGYSAAAAKAPAKLAQVRQAADNQYGIGNSVSNKRVARRFIMAIPSGDANEIRAVMLPDAILSLRIAGVYPAEFQAFQNGIQWNREELIKKEQDRAKAMKGPFTFKVLSMISDGDHVAAEVIAQGVRAANSRPYVQHYSYHLWIRHGRIVDARLYQDTFHEWDVWQNPGIATDLFKPPSTLSRAIPIRPSRPVTPQQVAANKATIRRWVNAIPSRSADAIRAELAPEIVWSFAMGGDYSPALRSFPRTYSMDREGMVKLQTSFQTDLKEPFTFDIYSMAAEGDEVCVELIGIDIQKEGRAYRQHYSIHFKLRDGKIVEGHVYQDTLHQFTLFAHKGNYDPKFAPIYPNERVSYRQLTR